MKIKVLAKYTALLSAVLLAAACSRPAKQVEAKKRAATTPEVDETPDPRQEQERETPGVDDIFAGGGTQNPITPPPIGGGSTTPPDTGSDQGGQSNQEKSLKELLEASGWDGKSNKSFITGWSIEKG